MGRRWQGGAGNLYASALLRLKQGDPPASTLALVAGVALHKALCEYITTSMLRIKWPNDIMAGPAKVSGLLLERVDDAIIIGVGVNITHAPAVEGRKTTSLHDIGADQCDATMLLHVLRRHLLTERADWRERGVAHSIKLWLERAHAPGTALSVIAPDGEKLEGCFHGLTEDGALILRNVQNKDHIIHAGDVFLI